MRLYFKTVLKTQYSLYLVLCGSIKISLFEATECNYFINAMVVEFIHQVSRRTDLHPRAKNLYLSFQKLAAMCMVHANLFILFYFYIFILALYKLHLRCRPIV